MEQRFRCGRTWTLSRTTEGSLLAVVHKAEPSEPEDVVANRDDLRFQTLFENLSVPCSIYDLSSVRNYLESVVDYESINNDETSELERSTLQEAIRRAESFGTNRAYKEFFDGETDPGQTLNLLNHLPLEGAVAQIFLKLMDGETQFRFETEVSDPDGNSFPVVLEVTLSPGHEHQWGRVYITLLDISERHHIQQKLHRSERAFEQINEQIEQIVWMFDLELEDVLYHNGPVETVYGCKPEAVEDNPRILLKMVHPDDRDRLEQELNRLIDGQSIDVEYRVNPNENYSRWVWTQGSPLKDDAGNIDRLAGFTKDVTSRKRMEFSLLKTKERYQSIFDQAQVGMAEISMEGRWLRVNPRLAEVLGYSKNELYQMEESSLIHPDDLEQDRSKKNQLLEGDIDSYTGEKRFKRQDGGFVWIKHTTTLVRDETGSPLYFIAIMEDIQHRREAQQELKRREKRYRNLVSDVPGIVYRCLCDEEWTMRFMSEDARRITGYPREDFIGNKRRSYNSIIHPEDREQVRRAVHQSLANDEPFEVEYRIRTKDQGDRWVLERGRGVTDPKSDEKLLHGVIVDVNQTKEAQKELRKSEERYRAVFEQAKVGLAEISFDEKWLSVNERLESMLGYQAEELEGRTCREITHPDSIESDARCAEKLINGEVDHFTSEKRYRHKQGHWVWVRMTVSRVDTPRDGFDGYFVAIIEDISEQKEAQRELRQSERRFRQLARTIDQVAWILNLDNGELEYLGPGLEDIWGQPAEEFEQIPDDLNDTILPEDRGRVESVFPSTPESMAEQEFRIQSTDGEIRWIHGQSFTFSEEEDPSQLVAGTFEDITERKRAEEELRESERRFRSTFEQAAVGMAHVDLDGTLLRLNEKFCELLGYSHDELKSKTFQELTHPDDLERDIEQVERLLEQEKDQYSIEKRYLRNDGTFFWAQLTVSLVLDDSGEPEYFVSVIEDITERKQTEQELKKSEEKFRELAENIQQVFWLSDSEKDELLYVSPAIEDIWGIDQEELYDNPQLWLDRVHPEDQNRVRKDLVERQKEGNYDEEYRIVRPDDSIRWIRDRAFPIRDDEGNVQRIAGIAEDITKKKRIEEEQETFFNISIDLFALSDYEGQFLDVNPAFSETLGYSRSELTSKPFLEFIHPDDIEETREVMAQLEEGKPVEGHENRYITKNGNIRWLNWRAEPGDDMIYAVARDVTERRRYEEQLQSMVEEKETLLKEIHHRVKNNLQIISSMLSMQMREIDQDGLREKIQDSINRVKSMALIHENLYQSDNLANLNFERYVRELTDRTVTLHQRDHSDVNVSIEVDSQSLKLDQAIPCGLILNELLTNTLEHGFTTGESANISIMFYSDDRKADLTVKDDGRGFPTDFDMDTIDTFGMQIVQSLVEYELNGSMSVENDNGAVIQITFPIED
ncbi:MAG: PAS domain S-box protein [bacterium]